VSEDERRGTFWQDLAAANQRYREQEGRRRHRERTHPPEPLSVENPASWWVRWRWTGPVVGPYNPAYPPPMPPQCSECGHHFSRGEEGGWITGPRDFDPYPALLCADCRDKLHSLAVRPSGLPPRRAAK
jgi:hypothetical protein